jgi:hypothetical protein
MPLRLRLPILAPPAAPPSGGGQIKVWDGAAFVAKSVKVWTGSAWVVKPLKYWNGTAWVLTDP